MAAKTSVFYLTERVTLAAGTNTENTDTIALGAYVDVADRQGVLVHAVDFVFQGKDTNTGNVTGLQNTMANDATIIAQ